MTAWQHGKAKSKRHWRGDGQKQEHRAKGHVEAHVLAVGQVAAKPLQAFQHGGIRAIGKNDGPLTLVRVSSMERGWGKGKGQGEPCP